MFLPNIISKKRLVLIFLGFFLLASLLSKAVQAYSTPGSTYQFQFENAVFKTDEMNLQSFVYEVMKAVQASSISLGPGCLTCDKQERQDNPGLFVTLPTLIAGVYSSPPASGVNYLAYLGGKIGIIQPVYAQPRFPQGLGFAQMESILDIWIAFRNLAYGLFVIIFVFIGFAIMFRVKISPETVITIESALPKIIIALLLITFSYAIVGFMIDMAYVLCFLITSLFKNIPIGTGVSIQNIIDQWSSWFPQSFMNTTHGLILETLYTDFVFFLVMPILSLTMLVIANPLLGPVIALFTILMLIIALLRCIWMLIKTYALIVVGLISAPLQIVVGALPGSDAIGSWFKTMLGHMAVLPVMTAMFFLASFLMFKGASLLVGDHLWELIMHIAGFLPGSAADIVSDIIDVITGFFGAPDISATFHGYILGMVGMVVLWMTPKAADVVKSFIMGKTFEYGTAIGELTGLPGKAVSYGTGAIREGGAVAEGWRKIRRNRVPETPGGQVPETPR